MKKNTAANDSVELTYDQLRTALEAEKKRSAKAEAKVERIEKQKEKAEAEAREQKRLRISAEKELTLYEQENARLSRENQKLTKVWDDLNTAILNSKDEVKCLSKELRSALKEVTDQKDRVKKLTRLATSTEARVKQLEANMTKLKDRNNEIRKQLKKLKKADNEKILEIQRLVREQDQTVRAINRLRASQSRDFKNSGIPSSACPGKAVVSTRKPTGRKPGAQQGHEFHGRKPLQGACLSSTVLEPPKKFLNPKRYAPTGQYKTHQRQDLHVISVYSEVKAEGYKNLRTGKIEYPPFPQEYRNDVNFSGRVKALLHGLTYRCNVSIGKTRQFLLDITGGQMDVSTGCICNLAKEFARKSKPEQEAGRNEIADSKVVQVDFTFGRQNKKLATVLITATPDGHALFLPREKKGLSALEGAPILVDGKGDCNKKQVVVCDHESTFAKHCGVAHQECLAHVERRLVGVTQQEKTMTWAQQMIQWISDSIHWRNQVVLEEEEYTEEKVNQFLAEYNRILDLGRTEYSAYPNGKPKPGYNEGVNLLKDLTETPDDYTLFLKDLEVPPTNSLCEVLARLFKRKTAEVMTFRSMGGVEAWCAFQTAVMEILSEGFELFDTMTSIFDRPVFKDYKEERKPRGKNKCHTAAIREAAGLGPDEVPGNTAAGISPGSGSLAKVS